MRLINWSPLYEPFLDIEKAFSDGITKSFTPAVDLYEKGDTLVAEVALVGFKPEDVKISIEDNVLNVEGSAKKTTEVDETQYYRKEVRTGSFHHMISLPMNVAADKTTAEYDRGILRITMPKREEHKSKPIAINIRK